MELRVFGFGFGIWGLVWASAFFTGLGVVVLGCRTWRVGFRVLGVQALGLRFRVLGFRGFGLLLGGSLVVQTADIVGVHGSK